MMIEDSIDMFTSTVWMHVKETIDNRIQNCMNKLVSAKDFNEVLHLQGQIHALKSLRAIDMDKEN